MTYPVSSLSQEQKGCVNTADSNNKKKKEYGEMKVPPVIPPLTVQNELVFTLKRSASGF